MPSNRMALLMGLGEAKEAVKDQADELKRGGARPDGGQRQSRLRRVVGGAKSKAKQAGSGARRTGEAARQAAIEGGQRGRRAAAALNQNELRYARRDIRRRGIPEETGSPTERAVEASIMGPPVQATLEPVTRPQDMQHFVAGTGMKRPPEPEGKMGIARLVGGGAPAPDPDDPLAMADPLGIGGGSGEKAEEKGKKSGMNGWGAGWF